MRGVILAAGRGSRLGPYTVDRPKCLVELRGRSLLDRQVRALLAAGVDEVAVVAGWRAELFDGTGLTVFRNDRWAETTMVESLAAAGQWLSTGPVLVSYGDIVYPAAAASALAAAEHEIAVAYDPQWLQLWRKRFADPLDDAETFRLGEPGVLAEIGGRPASVAEVEGQYLGLLRFTPDGWARVRRVLPGSAGLDMTGLLSFLMREHGVTIGAVPVPGPWFEFDHPSDLEPGLEVLAELDRVEEAP